MIWVKHLIFGFSMGENASFSPTCYLIVPFLLRLKGNIVLVFSSNSNTSPHVWYSTHCHPYIVCNRKLASKHAIVHIILGVSLTHWVWKLTGFGIGSKCCLFHQLATLIIFFWGLWAFFFSSFCSTTEMFLFC